MSMLLLRLVTLAHLVYCVMTAAVRIPLNLKKAEVQSDSSCKNQRRLDLSKDWIHEHFSHLSDIEAEDLIIRHKNNEE